MIHFVKKLKPGLKAMLSRLSPRSTTNESVVLWGLVLFFTMTALFLLWLVILSG